MPGRHWILTSAALPKGFSILGREATIGRDPSCELRLLAAEVSRRHAKILKTQRGYTIEDLRSANGTLVNGRPASKPINLEHEDLVSVGPIQLQFLIVDAERDQIAQRFSTGLDETDHVVQAEANKAALFSGAFTRETLHQVCQLIEFHKHSGVLRVEGGGCVGYLRLREGLIVDARFGPATGERGARALLGSLAGDYAFYPWRPDSGTAPPDGSLKLHMRALIMELLRSEESQERRALADGLLDERPDSDLRNAATPARGSRTQRIPRSALRPTEKLEKPEPGSSDDWRGLFDKK